MNIPHYVFGHQNPDADSLVSAYVLAWMYNKANENANAQAIRLGEPTPQGRWLFERLGLPLPELKPSCRILTQDVMTEAYTVTPDASLGEALRLVYAGKTDVVAVVDKNENVLGVISERNPRTTYLLQCNVEDFIGTLLNFENIRVGLDLLPLNNPADKIEGKRLIVATMPGDQFEQRLRSGDIVIADNFTRSLNFAEKKKAAAYIICNAGKELDPEAYRDVNIPVYTFPGSLISMIARLPGCFPATAAMDKNYVSVEKETLLRDSVKLGAKTLHSLLVFDERGKLCGFLRRRNLINRPVPRLSLVDHFEQTQSIEGIEEGQIVEIIDHHRIGDIETRDPVAIDCRPWGSTASILYSRIKDQRWKVPKDIAALLLGALVSDTLLLQSPTTTGIDRKYANELAKIMEENLETYGRQVLKMNDNLLRLSPEELVDLDCKSFKSGENSFLVCQIETVELDQLSPKLERALREAMELMVYAKGMTFGVIMVTDVLKSKSRILLVTQDIDIQQALLPEKHRGKQLTWDVEGMVSRKKQLIPEIMNNLAG